MVKIQKSTINNFGNSKSPSAYFIISIQSIKKGDNHAARKNYLCYENFCLLGLELSKVQNNVLECFEASWKQAYFYQKEAKEI